MATSDIKEIVNQLKLQRHILAAGGYAPSARTPWRQERLFRDSITCLNVFEDAERHPCNECLLWDWVPEHHRYQAIPCHFIPLDEQGRGIAELEEAGERERAERALLDWLNTTIQALEAKLSSAAVGCA